MGKKQDCLQNNQAKRAGGMVQTVEHKHKALSLNPSTGKQKHVPK
jgi:hypothetical protein